MSEWCRRDRVRRGSQQLSINEREERRSVAWNREDIRTAQILRYAAVQLLFIGRWGKVFDDAPAMCEPHVLANLTAKRSLNRSGEALPKLGRRGLAQAGLASIGDVSCSEGILWSQNLLVEQAHQPKQLEEVVLQRRCGEQQLRPAVQSSPERLAGLVRPSVRVA